MTSWVATSAPLKDAADNCRHSKNNHFVSEDCKCMPTCIATLILIWRVIEGVIHVVQLDANVILLAMMPRGRGRSRLATLWWRLQLLLSSVSSRLDRHCP